MSHALPAAPPPQGTAAPPQAAAPPLPPEAIHFLQRLFAFHVLTVRQKLFTLAEKYAVSDADGQPLFFVVRPPHIGQNILAGVGAFIGNVPFLILAFRLIFYQGEIVLALAALFVGGNLAALIRILLGPYRDVTVYTDESQQFPVLMMTQDNKFGLHRWFTIYDAVGNPVARAKRHVIKAIWRRRWEAETLDGRPICIVREDSFMLALLRRYFGPMYGLLRTNFDVLLPNGDRVGEYNRKLTLTDQYVLDVRQDGQFLIDRRVLLALAILLDTGERR